jgi:hypothetical protein
MPGESYPKYFWKGVVCGALLSACATIAAGGFYLQHHLKKDQEYANLVDQTAQLQNLKQENLGSQITQHQQHLEQRLEEINQHLAKEKKRSEQEKQKAQNETELLAKENSLGKELSVPAQDISNAERDWKQSCARNTCNKYLCKSRKLSKPIPAIFLKQQ